jgi:hypothetical protein
MLESLQVRNYVLMDSLDIVFPAGLGIITGQTGAGKSILLGALSLALGAKSDPSMVGEGADNCMVEAVFDMEGNSSLEEFFSENDLPWNGGSVTIRRVLGKSGRSRGFVNDEPAPVAVLQKMASSDCAGFALARGALIKPWIFKEILLGLLVSYHIYIVMGFACFGQKNCFRYLLNQGENPSDLPEHRLIDRLRVVGALPLA